MNSFDYFFERIIDFFQSPDRRVYLFWLSDFSCHTSLCPVSRGSQVGKQVIKINHCIQYFFVSICEGFNCDKRYSVLYKLDFLQVKLCCQYAYQPDSSNWLIVIKERSLVYMHGENITLFNRKFYFIKIGNFIILLENLKPVNVSR